MKRSEINRELRCAEAFFAEHGFRLPRFAFWTPCEWKRHGDEIAEIRDCGLGWDITDFGRGDFRGEGLLLFTIRNGVAGSPRYPKPYAEKIMISRSEQKTLLHCHKHKCEDIINRSGGNLVFELYCRADDCSGDDPEPADVPVGLSRDGEQIVVLPGEKLILAPGESITLEPHVLHSFYAERGADVLIGEVSAVNDDHNDNVYFRTQVRFPVIEEDEAPYRLLVSDY